MSADESPAPEVVRDIYKLAVEMADRVSARRSAANTFYLTLQTAGVGLLGLVSASSAEPDRWPLAAICCAGIATAVAWFLQLRSYRDLNRAKFSVICALEVQLPVSVFSDEWASLKRDPVPSWRPRYAELGTVERIVPWVFVALNLVLGMYFVRS